MMESDVVDLLLEIGRHEARALLRRLVRSIRQRVAYPAPSADEVTRARMVEVRCYLMADGRWCWELKAGDVHRRGTSFRMDEAQDTCATALHDVQCWTVQ